MTNSWMTHVMSVRISFYRFCNTGNRQLNTNLKNRLIRASSSWFFGFSFFLHTPKQSILTVVSKETNEHKAAKINAHTRLRENDCAHVLGRKQASKCVHTRLQSIKWHTICAVIKMHILGHDQASMCPHTWLLTNSPVAYCLLWNS